MSPVDMRLAAVLCLTAATACLAITRTKTRRDTYLEAYMDSHGPSSMPTGEVYASPSAAGGYSYNYPYPAAMTATGAEAHSAPDNPLDPVHGKLVLLFKVLLKLLIFKLIVKFIAIICVLFFLPKLSGLGLAKALDADARAQRTTDDRLDVTQFVLSALAGPPEFEDGCPDGDRDSAACRLRRALHLVDQRFPADRLFGVFLNEEKQLKHKPS